MELPAKEKEYQVTFTQKEADDIWKILNQFEGIFTEINGDGLGNYNIARMDWLVDIGDSLIGFLNRPMMKLVTGCDGLSKTGPGKPGFSIICFRRNISKAVEGGYIKELIGEEARDVVYVFPLLHFAP